MTRKETLKSTWIPIIVRLPPDTGDEIEVWNYVKEKTMTMESMIARLAGQLLISLSEEDHVNIAERLSWDRRISHWRPMVGPK